MEKNQSSAGKWHYDAFISYRHSDLDSFVAETLHRQLESFKLPRNVIRQKQQDKTRIHRVFRDKEELPLVSNLADPIRDALAQSEYLIVICSPRLNESMWCRKEIETFIGMHDREHVLAVLAEGEPETSFPQELLYREEEEFREDGSVVKQRVPVEPLAADVRGTNKREIRRKIKTEMLRLAAPMFACSYDDLKQRHRERRLKKMLGISAAAGAVCLLFGIVSTSMALRIQRQNERILQQSDEIKEQSEEIKAQSEEIERQYQEAVRANCVIQADIARRLLAEGDRIGAVETALAAFPKAESDDIPYTAQAAYALADSLRLYENGTLIMPDRLLEADTVVRFMKTSPEGGRILTVDEFGRLVLWDGVDGGRIKELQLEDTLLMEEEQVAFLDENAFFYPKGRGVALYDVTLGQDRYAVTENDQYSQFGVYRKMTYVKESDMAVIQYDEGVLFMRGTTGEPICAIDWTEENLQLQDACAVSEDGSLYAVSVIEDYYGKSTRAVKVYETAGETCVHTYPMRYPYIKHLRFAGETLYIINDGEEEGADTFDVLDMSAMRGVLYACDLTKETDSLWTYTAQGGWLYDISLASAEGSPYLVCSAYDELLAFDRESGKLLERFSFGSEIIELGNYVDSNAFLVFTRNGEWHYVNLDNMTDYVGVTFSQCTSSNVKAFAIGADYQATLPYQSKSVTLYRRAAAPNLTVLCELEKEPAGAALSPDGDYLALAHNGDAEGVEIALIDTQTGENVWEYAVEEGFFAGMEFCRLSLENDTDAGLYLVLVTDRGISLIEAESGAERSNIGFERVGMDYVSMTDGAVAVAGYDALYRYRIDSPGLPCSSSASELIRDRSAVADCGAFYAVITKSDNTLHLFMTEADREITSLPDINATYVENMFFDGTDALYLVYRDNSVRIFDIVGNKDGKTTSDVSLAERKEGYAPLHDALAARQRTETSYGALIGESDGYLTTAEGEITAHIDGFLALDAEEGVIYMSGANHLYCAPVYEPQALREEALKQMP